MLLGCDLDPHILPIQGARSGHLVCPERLAFRPLRHPGYGASRTPLSRQDVGIQVEQQHGHGRDNSAAGNHSLMTGHPHRIVNRFHETLAERGMRMYHSTPGCQIPPESQSGHSGRD